jgi:dTDP-4-dehydrorhamnose 3,5-epimerase
MQMRVQSKHLSDGVVVLAPEVFEDKRGFFMEAYRADQFEELGLPAEFVQDNHSGSTRGVTRGLHFQYDQPMAKLMRVTRGTCFLVAVDIRKGSPTLRQWFGIEASADNRIQVFAPAGFARGFCALSDFAEVQYKCTAIYSPNGESGVLWNDPDIGVEWPIDDPIVSDKDKNAQTLAEWLRTPESDHFRFGG